MCTLEKCLFFAIFVVISSIGSCSYATNAENNRAIEELVKQGQSAESAYCSVRGGATDIACQILIQQQRQQENN